jgi:hypothetical protein
MTTESAVHDQLTAFFIAENPSEIALERFKKEKTSAGGFKLVPHATLAPQTGRLVLGNRQLINRTLPGGRIVAPDGTIVFELGADVERHDKTTIDGDEYEVVFVKVLPWAVEAEVTRYGG